MNDQYNKVDVMGTESVPLTLTNAYTGQTKTIDIADAEQLILFLQYTTGAAETSNSVELKLEFSGDESGSNFYQETEEVVAAGVAVITPIEHQLVGALAATTYRVALALPVAAKRMKISAKETGVAANAGTVHVAMARTGV